MSEPRIQESLFKPFFVDGAVPVDPTADPPDGSFDVGKLIFSQFGDVFADTQHGRIPYVGLKEPLAIGTPVGGATRELQPFPRGTKFEDILRTMLSGPSTIGIFTIVGTPNSQTVGSTTVPGGTTNANRQAGNAITTINLNVNILRGSEAINTVRVERQLPGGSYTTVEERLNHAGGVIPFVDNNLGANGVTNGVLNYRVRVWDVSRTTSQDPHASSIRTFTFLYPPIVGSVPNTTPTAADLVGIMTSTFGSAPLQTVNTVVNYTFTPANSNGRRPFIAVPTNWRALSRVSIGGFEVNTQLFPRIDRNLIIGTAPAQAYAVYVYDAAWNITDSMATVFTF
jgi:hypothetical protein